MVLNHYTLNHDHNILHIDCYTPSLDHCALTIDHYRLVSDHYTPTLIFKYYHLIIMSAGKNTNQGIGKIVTWSLGVPYPSNQQAL